METLLAGDLPGGDSLVECDLSRPIARLNNFSILGYFIDVGVARPLPVAERGTPYGIPLHICTCFYILVEPSLECFVCGKESTGKRLGIHPYRARSLPILPRP